MKSFKTLLVGGFLALACMCSVSFSALADTPILGSESAQVKVIGFNATGFELSADQAVIVNSEAEIVTASFGPPGSEVHALSYDKFQTLAAADNARNYEEVGWRYRL